MIASINKLLYIFFWLLFKDNVLASFVDAFSTTFGKTSGDFLFNAALAKPESVQILDEKYVEYKFRGVSLFY